MYTEVISNPVVRFFEKLFSILDVTPWIRSSNNFSLDVGGPIIQVAVLNMPTVLALRETQHLAPYLSYVQNTKIDNHF